MRKYIFYPIFILLALSSVKPAFCGVKANSGDIVSTRAGRHNGFQRFVIELRHEAMYRVKKFDKAVRIDVFDVDSSGFMPGFTATRFFRLKKISTESKGGTLITHFRINLNGPAMIRDKVVIKPYRIVVDIYPDKTTKHLVSKKRFPIERAVKRGVIKKSPIERIGRKKTAKKPARKKADNKKFYTKPYSGGPYKTTFAFNEGWRWIYRKVAVDDLRSSFYGNFRDNGFEMLSEFIPVKGGNAWIDGIEARAYVKGLAKGGDEAGAVTLRAIISLMKKEADINDVESEIIRTPENTLSPLARFLLASAYEKEGLYPEAIAYYAMAYEAKTIKRLKARSALGRGRVLFFSGRTAESLRWFEKARKEGSQEALGWLAGSRLLKGEFTLAWADYKRLGVSKDPLSLMGLADIKMKRGDYSGAGLIFQGLWKRFSQRPFLSSFFALREGDALLASGFVKEGLSAYSAIKKRSKGEALAMADMALADYYSSAGKSPRKAKALYKEVARGTNFASGEALMRLAGVLEGLKEHSSAMRTFEEILPENSTSTGRVSTDFLRSKIAYNWIKDLYAEKKWLELVMVNYQYGSSVTFGRKAGNFLRAGEALMRLGLTPDAVKALKRAEQIGTREIKVKALLLLTRLYLDQRDGRAALNVLENLRVTSPDAARTSEWRDYNLEAQYLKGNYREVIGLGRRSDKGSLLLKMAASYSSLGMWPEATKTYSEAIVLFKKNGDSSGLIKAETGYGDSWFGSRGFIEAIDAYKRAEGMAEKRPAHLSNWAKYRLSLSYAEAGMRDKAMSTVKALKGRDKAYGEWAEAISLAQE